MEGVAEGVERGAIEEAEVIEAAEGVGVLLAVEEEADGSFAGETVGGELPATGATEEVEIIVGEFVEAADERVADATRAEPQEGVEEGVLEGCAAVDVGRVVGVALEVDGDGRGDEKQDLNCYCTQAFYDYENGSYYRNGSMKNS